MAARSRCAAWGAALSYHALCSSFPIWPVALSVLGPILGSETAIIQA
ncbi:hypothetical protein [Halomicronema sp. CCY15110]|nr:hypothetical protein [Halomicronema sp. CCY15110]